MIELQEEIKKYLSKNGFSELTDAELLKIGMGKNIDCDFGGTLKYIQDEVKEFGFTNILLIIPITNSIVLKDMSNENIEPVGMNISLVAGIDNIIKTWAWKNIKKWNMMIHEWNKK